MNRIYQLGFFWEVVIETQLKLLREKVEVFVSRNPRKLIYPIAGESGMMFKYLNATGHFFSPSLVSTFFSVLGSFLFTADLHCLPGEKHSYEQILSFASYRFYYWRETILFLRHSLKNPRDRLWLAKLGSITVPEPINCGWLGKGRQEGRIMLGWQDELATHHSSSSRLAWACSHDGRRAPSNMVSPSVMYFSSFCVHPIC